MFSLFILMLERVGLIILIAYLLMNAPHFKRVMAERSRFSSIIQLLLVFGLFAVLSNFTGVSIKDNHIVSSEIFTSLKQHTSIANTRVLIISVAGLVGGPYVGIGVGIITGISRFLLGGQDAMTYVYSSVVIGIIAGFIGHRTINQSRYPTIIQGFVIGAMLEAIQMLFIIGLANDTVAAIALVKFIAPSMILINALGTAIFLSIINSTLRQEEQTRAVQTHDVLSVANKTLPYFRAGLTEASAKEAATIIREMLKLSAVSITNETDILAHVGAASDHHRPKKRIITDLSKDVIRTNQIQEAHSKEEIGCTHPGCPLEGAIVIPLHIHDEVVGTLKFYFTDSSKLTYVERRLAEGLGEIFSSQLELGRLDLQRKLLKDAEIKSLQAQVNPHFFFNAVNTISALMRIDTEKARELLLSLSQFFRANLQGARTNTITVDKELQQVHAYLKLEQARFPNRFDVAFDICAQCHEAEVPPFLIQILVENAIKHAFGNRKTDNRIVVSVSKSDGLYIRVEDNGLGIDPEKRSLIGKVPVESQSGTGSALENLNKRLISIFGQSAELKFDTDENGTIFYCKIPIQEEHSI